MLKDKNTEQKSLSIEYYSDFCNFIFTSKHNALEKRKKKEQYKTMGKLNKNKKIRLNLDLWPKNS